jgi:ankyrin repeat protein
MDVNAPINFDMGNALHIAGMKGHLDTMQRLIHRGAKVNSVNYAKQTSLHAACEANNGEVAWELLASGCNADQRDAVGQTPMHRAAFVGAIEALRALLDYGANVKVRDEGRQLPIHKAAMMGRQAALQLLLQRDPNSVNAEANDGWTCLHLAAHHGHSAAVEILLRYGADVTLRDAERMQPLHRAASAATSGNVETCQVLLRAGADITAGDVSRWTPLHHACEAGAAMVVRALLQNEPPAVLDARDGRRRTALHIATEEGQEEVCELLMQFGADPHAGDMAKGVPSPLVVARRHRNQKLISLFIGNQTTQDLQSLQDSIVQSEQKIQQLEQSRALYQQRKTNSVPDPLSGYEGMSVQDPMK